MQVEWRLVTIVFNVLTAVQRMADELLKHFSGEFSVGDCEAEILIIQ